MQHTLCSTRVYLCWHKENCDYVRPAPISTSTITIISTISKTQSPTLCVKATFIGGNGTFTLHAAHIK